MTLRRGFTVSPGEKTLVVEDVITTGGSTRDTIEALKRAGADVVAAAAIIDRSAGSADVGVPLSALAALKVLAVSAADCDACKLGEAVVKPGSRKATK
jgi:orotate phosphoribosyltransferase